MKIKINFIEIDSLYQLLILWSQIDWRLLFVYRKFVDTKLQKYAK